MAAKYDAADIEVLSGLDPVRKRPGMYTDTSRPNHLAQEVIDNSVDEAIVGHAKKIEVIVHKDGSLSVQDDGRGMPVDVHPKEKITGVELILTGLHGVGVSVVNALSSKLEVWVKRNGKRWHMGFKDGKRVTKLDEQGEVGKANTGTLLRFWPDPKYFDSPKFSIPKLKHVLRAKAVLCPGLTVKFINEQTLEKEEWHYVEDRKS